MYEHPGLLHAAASTSPATPSARRIAPTAAVTTTTTTAARFHSDDADLAGYRDMNYAILFNGVVCELQTMLHVSHNPCCVPRNVT